MQIEMTRKAEKDLRKIDRADAARIVSKIKQFAADPASLSNNVKSLAGTDTYRLRVADYRVIYRVEGEIVTVMVVLRIRHRREAYD